jgi:outer membrane protein OmpA-like peptidoglycan-associated protein
MRLKSNYSFLFLIVVLLANVTLAQTSEEKKILKKARKELTQGNYENAKLAYSNLIKLDGKESLYYFESGLAHYNSYYQREKALDLFKSALAYSKKDTIAEIFLYLGKTHQYLNNFSEAITNYNTFKDYTKLNREGTYILLEVDQLIEKCNNGIALQENKPNQNITAENIGGNINSRYAEYGQVVNSKSDALLFTTRDRENTGNKLYNDNKKYEDIYISTKKDRKWVDKVNVDSANHFFSAKINTKKHDGVIGFSDNDEKLYIYQNNGVLVSTKKDGKYGEPVELETVNSTGREPSAFLSKNGKKMFFSSSRKGGKGGLDLYYALQQADGSWSEPINMAALNTELNEDAPYLSNDGKVLFFASQGHNSVGGYDIFQSTQDQEGVWSKPTNIGLNYNSGGDDIYYIQDSVDNVGYFSSSRANGYGDVDIYKFYPTPATKEMQLFAGVGKPAYKVNNDANYLDKATGDIYTSKDGVWEMSRQRIATGSGIPVEPPVIPANIYINTDNADVFARQEDNNWKNFGGGIDYGNGLPTEPGRTGDIYVDKDSGKTYVYEFGNWKQQKGSVKIGRGIPDELADKGAVFVNVRTGNTYVFDGKRWQNKKGGLTEAEGEPVSEGKSGDIYLNSSNGDMYVHDGTTWKMVDAGRLETKGPPKEIADKGTIYYDKASDDIYVSDGTKWIKHGDEFPNDCDNIANTEIRGLAYQGEFNNPVYVMIKAFNAATGQEVGQWESDKNSGKYLMVLPPENTYYLEITNPDWDLSRPFRDTITIPKQCEIYQLFQKVHFNDVNDQDQLVAKEAIFDNAMFDIKEESMKTFGLTNFEDGIVAEKNTSTHQIAGTLIHNELLATSNVEVSLVNELNEIIHVTRTDEKGKFKFQGVEKESKYGLLIDEKDVKLSYYGNQPNNSENSVILKGGILIQEVKDNKVVDSQKMNGLEAVLVSDEKEVISSVKANEDGEFVLDNVSSEDKVDDRVFKYQIKMADEDALYSNYLSTIDTSENEFYSIVRDLLGIDKDEPIVVNNTEPKNNVAQADYKLNPIYFDFDKFFLRLNSKEILDKLYEYMTNNPEFSLQIVGHTDWMGTEDYNMSLSKKRALSAFKYLKKKGISENDLVIKWYGESQPKVPNANPDGSDNEENRQLNRRCEFSFESNETAYTITIM